MLNVANADLETRILRHLARGPASAHTTARTLGVTRQRISDRMTSLKKAGKVVHEGAWMLAERAKARAE